MANFDFTLTAQSRLNGLDLTIGDMHLTERAELAIVSVAVPLGDEAAFDTGLKTGLGLEPPSPTLSTTSGQTRAIRTTPDQIFLLFPQETPDAEKSVRSKLDDAGYTTDQTDGWIVLELTGPSALTALERLSPVDLSQAAFPIDATARTMMEHLGALIIRTGSCFVTAVASPTAFTMEAPPEGRLKLAAL